MAFSLERAGGRKAWEYRWYEVQPDGSRRRRNLVLRTLEQYPNETATQKAVVALRGDINAESPRMNLAPMSIQMRLAEALYNWRLASPYPLSEDWVFASPHSNGRLPSWSGTVYRAHILPAAQKLGIEGIGWHTFRRTYATFLKANGEDVKAVQELLRHANSLVTLNLYAQAITQNKRDAQSRIVTMVLDDNRLCKAQPSGGHFRLSDHNGPTKF